MPKMKQYVGLDVSLAETSIAIIDEKDRVVWRGKSRRRLMRSPKR
jgi:hypothetical protein